MALTVSQVARLAKISIRTLHHSGWFYPCSHALHRGLGELYVNDARFTASLDGVRPGLARYAHEAFQANAGRALAQ